MTLKIGHRGAAGHAPENTLASFEKAISLGVDMVEVDVHKCLSGEIVAIHDETVNRTTNGRGVVARKSLAKLKEFKIAPKERIPTLKEVLGQIDRRVKVNIEMKVTGIAEDISNIIDEYVKDHGWFYEDFLVSSFSYYELWQLYRLNKRIRLGILVDGGIQFDFIFFAKRIDAYSLNFRLTPFSKLFIKYFIDKAHSIGLKFFVWTVNKHSDITKLKGLKADGIISDYPDRI